VPVLEEADLKLREHRQLLILGVVAAAAALITILITESSMAVQAVRAL
jgi:hypothetical protein